MSLTKFSAASGHFQQAQDYVFFVLSHYEVVGFEQQALEDLQAVSVESK